MAFHLKNRNMPKALYWLSWMNEWDKLNSSKKRFGRFDVGSRSVGGVDNKYHQNVKFQLYLLLFFLTQSLKTDKLTLQNYKSLYFFHLNYLNND